MTVIESISALASGTRTNSTVTAPAGIANDDVLVYALAIGGASGGVTATPPTGFTVGAGLPVLYTWDGVDTYTVRLYMWWKVAASESGNYTAAHSSADTTAFMWRISGAVTSSPSNPSPTTQIALGGDGTAGNVLTAPTLTTPSDGSALLWIGGTWDGFGAATPTSGFTERRNVVTESFYAQDSIQATAGASGAKAVTSTQGEDRPKGCVMMCIEAAADEPDNDISALGSLSIAGAADLDATGTLVAAGALAMTGAADLDATGNLLAAGTLAITGAADLDARGSLVAAGTLSIVAAADLDAVGRLLAAGTIVINGAADLTAGADNDLAAVGALSVTGSADLDAVGSLTAAGPIAINGSASLTGSVNGIAAVGSLSITGAADLDAIGRILAAGTISVSGSADLDAQGTLTAVGSLAINGAASLMGVAANDLNALGSLSIAGAASLTAFGRLIATGTITITGAASLVSGAPVVAFQSTTVYGPADVTVSGPTNTTVYG